MSHQLIDLYIERVLRLAELPEAKAAEVREEIAVHLTESQEQLMKTGLDEEKAAWQAIQAYGHPRVVGRRLQRPWQWIDIRNHGTARGFIAMGPRAVGVFAVGGVAMGVFAVGGVSIGLFGVGGLALGLLLAWGGVCVGGVAYGGFTVGLVAAGGFAAGLVGRGGLTYALLCPALGKNAMVHSYYTLANAPEFLKSMLPLLEIPYFINRNLWLFMLLMPSVIMYFVRRERSKDAPNTPENWLLE